MRDFYETIVGPGPFLYRSRHGCKSADSHDFWAVFFYHRSGGGGISPFRRVLAISVPPTGGNTPFGDSAHKKLQGTGPWSFKILFKLSRLSRNAGKKYIHTSFLLRHSLLP